MEKSDNAERDPVLLAARASAYFQNADPSNCHILISCSKSKGTHRDIARNMYVSPLYRKSVLLAEAWDLPFSILSAKYGLLNPDTLIDPYDLTLKGATQEFKFDWGRRVDAQIRDRLGTRKNFVVLAGDDYYGPLLEAGKGAQLSYFAPMRGLSLGRAIIVHRYLGCMSVAP